MSKNKDYSPENIVKALRICRKDLGCTGCPLRGYKFCVGNMKKTAADLIEEQQREIERLREENRWIPVEERKPDEEYAAALAQGDEDVEVIAMIQGGDVATALRYDGDIGVFFAVDDGEFIAYTVTHWKPMPKGVEVHG